MSSSASENIDTTYDRDKVIKIINSVIHKVEQAEEISRETLFSEMSDLRNIIETMRSEIRGLQPADIPGKHIPSATDELDAVVEATATATGRIMDSCEAITTMIEPLPSSNSKDKLQAEVTNIFEACSFQDITGQRITKVINSLKQIETKVNHLMQVLGDKLPMSQGASSDEDTRVGDARLLNGPQMPDKAISQADIDKLLADF